MAFFKHTHVPPREQQQYSIETLKYNPSPERRGYIAVDSQHFCVRCCCVSNLPARPSREETAVVILTFYTGWQKWFDLLWEFCAFFKFVVQCNSYDNLGPSQEIRTICPFYCSVWCHVETARNQDQVPGVSPRERLARNESDEAHNVYESSTFSSGGPCRVPGAELFIRLVVPERWWHV